MGERERKGRELSWVVACVRCWCASVWALTVRACACVCVCVCVGGLIGGIAVCQQSTTAISTAVDTVR